MTGEYSGPTMYWKLGATSPTEDLHPNDNADKLDDDCGKVNNYPLVICYIAMENGPFIVDLPIEMVIFHSYVSLPEGILNFNSLEPDSEIAWNQAWDSRI